MLRPLAGNAGASSPRRPRQRFFWRFYCVFARRGGATAPPFIGGVRRGRAGKHQWLRQNAGPYPQCRPYPACSCDRMAARCRVRQRNARNDTVSVTADGCPANAVPRLAPIFGFVSGEVVVARPEARRFFRNLFKSSRAFVLHCFVGFNHSRCCFSQNPNAGPDCIADGTSDLHAEGLPATALYLAGWLQLPAPPG